jgi:hypothetical protein
LDREKVAGRHERRRTQTSWEMATGTLACPACDAPVLPSIAPMSPPDPIARGFCQHVGAVRDFVTLGEPTRPTHVVVRVRWAVKESNLQHCD